MSEISENKISVLYEDESLVVLNKPAGISVHSDGVRKEETLADWLEKKYPGIESVGEPIKTSSGVEIKKSGIVHRLDKETSGAIVVAKNQETFLFLKKQFQEREVFKSYRAFVYGEVKEDNGLIDKPIGRSKKDFRLRTTEKNMRGKVRPALTEYKVLKRSKDFSFLEAIPKTGRTHQIRVHLKSINHAIVCDKLYAANRPCALGFNRLALHAFQLRFKKPGNEIIDIEAPFPADFEVVSRDLN